MSAPAELRPVTDASPFTLIDDDGPQLPDLRAAGQALWTRRGLLAMGAAAGAVVAFAIALLLPPVYVATVAVLEAPRAGANSTLDQLGLSAEVLGIKGPASSGSALTYPDILRSRRVLESLLVRRFPTHTGASVRLVDALQPGSDSPQRTELALRELRHRFDVVLDRHTNLLRLSVSDRDPVLAAAVANAACEKLQDVVMNAMTTQAGANRRFIETRLAGAEVELSRAEGALRAFREQNAHPEGSPRLSLEQLALLREMRTREEVVIALTRQYEMARVDENRDVPVLNVLDPAEPPAFRSSPRRGMMAAGGALLGLALAIAIAWPRPALAEVPLREAA